MSIIKAININKSYFTKDNKTKVSVLNDVNLSIENSEMVALMGPSGVGKSTLLYILGSLESADSGEVIIEINNKIYNLQKLSTKELTYFRNSLLGFIFQFHYLLPEFNAIENVQLPALIKGESQTISKIKAMELLEFVGLKDRAEHKPSELSGGEQQRTAIARALINKPSILLADEPTGSLDHNNSEIILNLLKSINKEFGITSIIATHSEQIASFCSRIVKMKDGTIYQQNS